MPTEVPRPADAQALLDALPDGVVLAGRRTDGSPTSTPRRAACSGAGASSACRSREALPLQDLDSCGWWETLTPYDGLATRPGSPSRRGCCPTAPSCS